jgi:adenylate cyclase
MLARSYQGLESIQLKLGDKTLAIPVDEQVSALIPFRGFGGPEGGLVPVCVGARPAVQGAAGRRPEGQDRAGGHHGARPAGSARHAGQRDLSRCRGACQRDLRPARRQDLVKPDYAIGYEVVVLLLAGLVLAFALPLVSATRAVVLSVVVLPWWPG